MQRRGPLFRRASVAFNMTPMIDVVFLLIIFFLVSSHLAQRENRIPVELPQAVSGQDDMVQPNRRVTLTIEKDGATWLGGHPIGPSELRSRLHDQRLQLGDDLEVRIRCDRSVPYRQVEPVLNAAADASIWNVTFAVLQPRESAR